jgi:hypothetical protein
VLLLQRLDLLRDPGILLLVASGIEEAAALLEPLPLDRETLVLEVALLGEKLALRDLKPISTRKRPAARPPRPRRA